MQKWPVLWWTRWKEEGKKKKGHSLVLKGPPDLPGNNSVQTFYLLFCCSTNTKEMTGTVTDWKNSGKQQTRDVAASAGFIASLFQWLYWLGERFLSNGNIVCGAATFYKETLFDLSAVYFRLSFHRYLLFRSAFDSRMMLTDLKQAFKRNVHYFTM